MPDRQLRLLDIDGQYVRTIDEQEASELIRAGQATLRTGGRRPILMLTNKKTVKDFANGVSRVAKPAINSTYTEQHAGRRVVMMKRPARGGDLQEWDNELTFDELRQGRFISTTRAIEMQLAERARRNEKDRLNNERKAA